ncbi:MAG: hypothetical protein MJY62_06240 [Bacteroidales bacterium]|nr:hypothetical protein [Bacteroidales bacterium]
MIEKMTKYSFILLSGKKDEFLESLRELGLVDISRSSKPVDEHSARILSRMEALKARIHELERGEDAESAALKAASDALALEKAETAAWGQWDPQRIDSLEKAGVELHFYRIPAKKFSADLENEYPLTVCSNDSKTVCVCLAGSAEGFPFKENASLPSRTLSQVEADIASNEAAIKAHKEELVQHKSDIGTLLAEIDALNSDLNLYLASLKAETAAEDVLTVFEGFAPTEDDAFLSEKFDKMDCYYMATKAEAGDNPPIKFRNNRFVRMFETLTDMYGRPAYNGFDPTPYISVFFLLFFAMCMGDAGYGIVLVAVGLLLKKVKSFASLAPLVTTLGVGTIIVGFLFHTFFSIDISQWNCIPDCLKAVMVPKTIAGYDGTMILALVVGIVHLCLAMTVKAVYAVKNNGLLGSLGVCGWTLLIVGSVVVLTFCLAGVLDKDITRLVIIILGIVSAIGIFLLNDIHRNPLLNVGSGLWETYNTVTGVLGDVLSYLRLYALGLAGSMLGFAFNDLAKMTLGDGGLGWIPFVLIALVGHVLNIAMAALGAFVHPLRLNFLEFFKNSGYEPAGTKYNPLKK